MPNFSGTWSTAQQFEARSQGIWPKKPDAPTIGVATALSDSSASVTFTPPVANCYAGGATSYTVTSSPGCKTASGSSSPISVTGLNATTSYTFKVKARNALGASACSGSSNSISTFAAPGSQSYTTPGTYSWVAPTGVTSVSAVFIGGGANGNWAGCAASGGGGGGLGFVNNYAVTPGNSYSITVGGAGGNSVFVNTSYVAYGGSGTSGGSRSTALGGDGGNGAYFKASGRLSSAGGGGAAGYSGNGGTGGYNASGGASSGTAGNGGGGGGGGTANNQTGFAGGGVGVFGQGANGSAAAGQVGGGGSGGTQGYKIGGNYGGGGASDFASAYAGGPGAVRIVWPGTTRQFPSTNVGTP